MSKYNKEELENLILVQNLPYDTIGKQFGVSGNAIRKAAVRLGISLPQRRALSDKETFNRGSKRSKVYMVTDSIYEEIINNNDTWIGIAKALGYSNNLSPNIKELIKDRCKELSLELTIKEVNVVGNYTKKEIFEIRKNWQSARSGIQKDARKNFFSNTEIAKCHICGYDKHVEVAHIKSVSDFCENTLVEDINNIENLVGLCPNHHWEYDNGLLEL